MVDTVNIHDAKTHLLRLVERVETQPPMHHRDPFDRMILAQAMRLDAVVVSAERALDPYDVPVLRA